MRFWILQARHDHQPAAAPAPRAPTTVFMIGYDCWGVAPCSSLSSPAIVGLEPERQGETASAPETEPRHG